jgi:hypothetical protein
VTAADLLLEVHRHGGRLIASGDRIRVTAPAPLPASLMARLRAAKPELLPLVSCLAREDLTDADLMTPTGLAALGRVIEARLMREQGRVPHGWTAVSECVRCGPVYVWPGSPPRLAGCAWCFSRVAGRPIPRPPFSQQRHDAAKGKR